MYMVTCSFVLALATIVVAISKCPNGGHIYTIGISDQGKKDVVKAHNKYRRQIMKGEVKGQPKGKNVHKLVYDTVLGVKARAVTQQCKMQKSSAKDDRFDSVGQNIYVSWWSAENTVQNWTAAVGKWFSQHDNFTYPNKSNGEVGAYTQVVASKSRYVGCDFIAYFDSSNRRFPYARLYTCNYGPGGNWEGLAPYELA